MKSLVSVPPLGILSFCPTLVVFPDPLKADGVQLPLASRDQRKSYLLLAVGREHTRHQGSANLKQRSLAMRLVPVC